MSRARHKAKGGGVVHWNAGESQPAAKEAEERKKGGRANMHAEGEKAKERSDRPRRAKGGRVKGAGVGANLTPLSTAAKIRTITKGEMPEDSAKSD